VIIREIWLTQIQSLGVTCWFIPISKKLDEIFPVVEFQGAFLAMAPTSFIPLP
jgi:hypothetical protein